MPAAGRVPKAVKPEKVEVPTLVSVEEAERRKPRAPAKLSRAGRTLWRDLTSVFEFDERELLVLASAARQADLNARLEALVEGDGLVVIGAAGQVRLSAAVGELRQGRLAQARLLESLALPDERGQVQSAQGRRAAHASNARWDRERAMRGER